MPRTEDPFAGILPFFHTAEERSFGGAARRLRLTPAAVSKAVIRLEQSVGVKLLARTSRTVSLTPEGAVFLERCRIAISNVQAGREQMSQARRMPHGEVHVTMPFILGPIVARALPTLASRFRNLTMRISVTDRPVRLVDESIDVAIRIGAREDSSLISRVLRESRWVVVASPVYVGQRGLPTQLNELGKHNCLQFVAPNGRARDWAFVDPSSRRSLSLAVEGSLLIDQGEYILQAALAGLGICQVLDFMADDLVRQGRLVELLGAYAAPGPPINALAAPDRSKSANVRAVFAFLVDTFAKTVATPPSA